MTTQRESSRREWSSGNTRDEINSGSLQRIADACELMATSYKELIDERNLFRDQSISRRARIETLDRRIAALRGVITKLQKRRNHEPHPTPAPNIALSTEPPRAPSDPGQDRNLDIRSRDRVCHCARGAAVSIDRAEINKLRADLARVTAERDEARLELHEFVAQQAAIELQRDEYKRDAERYRWLRLPGSDIPISREAARDPDVYDAAIDAAMQERDDG